MKCIYNAGTLKPLISDRIPPPDKHPEHEGVECDAEDAAEGV